MGCGASKYAPAPEAVEDELTGRIAEIQEQLKAAEVAGKKNLANMERQVQHQQESQKARLAGLVAAKDEEKQDALREKDTLWEEQKSASAVHMEQCKMKMREARDEKEALLRQKEAEVQEANERKNREAEESQVIPMPVRVMCVPQWYGQLHDHVLDPKTILVLQSRLQIVDSQSKAATELAAAQEQVRARVSLEKAQVMNHYSVTVHLGRAFVCWQ